MLFKLQIFINKKVRNNTETKFRMNSQYLGYKAKKKILA